MKKLAFFLVCFGIIAVLGGGFLAPSAHAILGDINGDGNLIFNSDFIYMRDFLFLGGPPPPNPIDADIDGSPGINMGDLLQLIGYYFGGCSFLPYTGASVRVNSQIRFSSDLIFPMSSGTLDTTYIKIIANGGPDLMGMVIPLSYANLPGEVEVDLDQVSFTGSILPAGWNKSAHIDNTNKKVLIYIYPNSTDPPLVSGTTGIVATLYFTKVADGDPLAISATEIPPSHQFILISAYCADGVSPSERIFTPMLSLALNGDVNCDGIVDVGDVVYTINYLFKHGPPPCGM
ncbi:MAG TPA: hypothetical protein VF369_07310 [candidate division Zixibacteria bacterium]